VVVDIGTHLISNKILIKIWLPGWIFQQKLLENVPPCRAICHGHQDVPSQGPVYELHLPDGTDAGPGVCRVNGGPEWTNKDPPVNRYHMKHGYRDFPVNHGNAMEDCLA